MQQIYELIRDADRNYLSLWDNYMQNKPRYFFIALIVALLALVAWYLKTIVLYICIAIVISLIGQPLVRFYSKLRIRKIHLPGSLASLLALATIVLFAGI